ncbi:MAG TPA: hypothetical protein PL181_17060 [bacterium]|nr:hypothetical protein [bacterium]
MSNELLRETAFRIRAEFRMIHEKIDLFMINRGGDEVVAAMPLEYQKFDRSAMIAPFVSVSISEAQQLMDELWRCGLRPSEGSGSAGMMKATQDHLNDMRKIAFMSLNKCGIGPRKEE